MGGGGGHEGVALRVVSQQLSPLLSWGKMKWLVQRPDVVVADEESASLSCSLITFKFRY